MSFEDGIYEDSEELNISQEIASHIDEADKQYIKTALQVPPIPETEVEDIKIVLTERERLIDELFGDYIGPLGRGVAENVKFLPTKPYLEKYVENESGKINIYLPTGYRSRIDGSIVVHTTDLEEGKQWGRGDILYNATHEMIHGKVVPKFIEENIDGVDLIRRKTGCKVVTTSKDGSLYDEEGNFYGAYHRRMYEAQTEIITALTMYSSDKLSMYKNPYDFFRDISTGGGYSSTCEALISVLETAYPDVKEGVMFLGKSYFNCEGEEFFSKLKQKVVERVKDKEEAVKIMEGFENASKNEDRDEINALGERIKMLEKE